MIFGRVALLGDAAFVARPHVIAGVTKAALDAQGLADALAEAGLDRALDRYDQERRSFGRQIVTHARHLGAYVETGASCAKAIPMRILIRTLDAVLRDYGAPHLLRDPIL